MCFPALLQHWLIIIGLLLRLRLRSSCPFWNTGRRVISIWHGHWQHFYLIMSAITTDTHLSHILCKCIPPCPLWLARLLLLPSGVQSNTKLAGLDVGRRNTCPMNLLRLVATVSCRSPMPAFCRSYSFVIWSFRDTPSMSRRHLLLNTLSILFVLSVVRHVSLA